MKKIYNIVTTLCFLYFFIMLFCDISHVINSKENIESSVPLLYKNIIYFGGNMQSSDNFFFQMHESNNWGMFADHNFLMIDYPGYGYSSGTTNYNNIIKATDSIYQFVKESSYYGNNKIIIMGFSLGTGVATYVASSHNTDGLILIAPYNNCLLYTSDAADDTLRV